MDPRIQKLAENLIRFSTRVQPGENVLIQARNETDELVKALVRETYAAGGNPFVWLHNTSIERELAMNCNEEQLKLRAQVDGMLMEKMDVYIGYTAVQNDSEMCDVPPEKLELVSRLYEEPVHGMIRVPKTR